VGDAIALPEGAAGRVLAAFSGWPGEPYATIRRAGSWISSGERDVDLTSVAAAVFGPDRQLAGALTIGGPRRRIDPVAEEVRTLLLAAASSASRRLGGLPVPGAAVAG
jgi:hypothetical protein